MAYNKTVWNDRLVENPNTYTVLDNGDGTKVITENPGQVFVPGTELKAENLNKIEEGLEEVSESLDNITLSSMNMLDNSNFDSWYSGKYGVSNLLQTVESLNENRFLKLAKVTSSVSTFSVVIPSHIVDDFRNGEDFVMSIRLGSACNISIGNTSTVTVVDGPYLISPGTTLDIHHVRLKFTPEVSNKTITLTITGSPSQETFIDWMRVTPGKQGGQWIPSKNDLTKYTNDFPTATTYNFNDKLPIGKYFVPASVATTTGAPEGYAIGTAGFLDVNTHVGETPDTRIIQRLQQFGVLRLWYRSIVIDNGVTTIGAWVSSKPEIATTTEAQQGLNNTKMMTPKSTADAINYASLYRYATTTQDTSTNDLIVLTLDKPVESNTIPAGLTITFSLQKTVTLTNPRLSITLPNGSNNRQLKNNDGTDIAPNTLKANALYTAVFNGTNFRLVRGGGGSFSGIVKNIQRGTATMSDTVTSVTVSISNVNYSKSVLKFTYQRNMTSDGSGRTFYTLGKIAENGNSITFSLDTPLTNGGVAISWQVIEFEDFIEIIKGAANIPTTTSTVNVPISGISGDTHTMVFSFKTTSNGTFTPAIRGTINNNSLNFSSRSSNANVDIDYAVIKLGGY